MNLKQFALLFLTISVAWDIATTTVGLTFEGVYELNPRARFLMRTGFQLPFEVGLIIFFLIYTWAMEKAANHFKAPSSIAYVGVLIYSSIRAMAGFWNLAVIISVL